jgi:hypothetical protein
MKKNFLMVLIFVSVALSNALAQDPATNEWGAPTNNVQMSIRLKNGGKETSLKKPVELLIRYRNISTNETFILNRLNDIEMDTSYSFTVLSPEGKNICPGVTETAFSGDIIRLGPNQVAELNFNLSVRCKFDEIGTYKIIAKNTEIVSEKNKAFEVVSNPLYVSVVPEK